MRKTCVWVVESLRVSTVQVLEVLRSLAPANRSLGINSAFVRSFHTVSAQLFAQAKIEFNSVGSRLIHTIHSTNDMYNKGNTL